MRVVSARSSWRVLVVEDDARLSMVLADAFRQEGHFVATAGTVAEGISTLAAEEFSACLVDVELPDGDATEFVSAALARPAVPVIVAMSGAAHPACSFRLAQLGVTRYLTKPFELATAIEALGEAVTAAPDLTPQLRSLVGKVPVHEVERTVRSTMVREALARSDGGRTRAAALLAVSRQLLQHMLRQLGWDARPTG